MNTRERFLATMRFEPLDRPLYWEFAYWVGTMRRWYREGLPLRHGIAESLGNSAAVSGEALGIDYRKPNQGLDVNAVLGFDEFARRIPVNNCFVPPFETRVIEDHGDWLIMVNGDGETVQIEKGGGSQRVLDAAVKNIDDFERIVAERFNAKNIKERMPENWDSLKTQYKNRTFPLIYGGHLGFFMTCRRLLTFELQMRAYYFQPELIKRINQHVVDLQIALYEPLLQELGGEAALISEDFCYKSGCFISPALFREFCMPYYRQLTDFFRSYGIETIIVDSDGLVTPILDLLIESGVDALFPWEVQSGNDIVEVRKQYPKFKILGGIDKREIEKGKDAIDRELEKKVPFLLRSGGYVPFIDHAVHPDVSWENFQYYRQRLEAITRAVLE